MDSKPLKIDRTKLRKISTYAKDYGYTPQRIYQLAAEKKITIVEIDGVKFIQV
jgi:hypothetical protein